MKFAGLRAVWTAAGILFVVAGVALALILIQSMNPDVQLLPIRAEVIPRYAVAVAVLLLAWGGPARRSVLTQPVLGWTAVVGFVAFPFVAGLASASGAIGNTPALRLVSGLIVAAAGYVIMRQAVQSGLIRPSLRWVARIVVVLWIATQVVALTPMPGLLYFMLGQASATAFTYLLILALPGLCAILIGVVVLASVPPLARVVDPSPAAPTI